MKKLALLFLIFSLKATVDEAEEILLKKKRTARVYQATQATQGVNVKPIDAQPGTSSEPPRVVFEKSCCGFKEVDPFEAASYCCWLGLLCVQGCSGN